MDKENNERAAEIRKFNRFYTNIIGLVNQGILDSSYSLAEARVLLEIDRAGQCTATDLTKFLLIDPGYLSRIIRRFKREVLVTTTKSEADGRAQLLAVTAKGRETMGALSETSTRQIIVLLDKLSKTEQQLLVDHMRAIQGLLCESKNDSVIIRSQRPGDAGYVSYMHGVLYEKEYGMDRVFEQYVISGIAKFLETKSEGNLWVAEAGGRIIGSIGIVGVDKETAQLRWFLLEPEYRGTGLGRRLMNVAMDYCREKDFKKIFLWTFQGLDAARHLYRSFGFTPTEEVENNTWRDKLVEERWDYIV